jgi:hypothetical protein
MAQSKLIDTARRMRTIAEALNNSADRAIAAQYADDVARLARIEVPEPKAIPLVGTQGAATLAIMGLVLKRAFEPPSSPLAEDLLVELSRSRRTQTFKSQPRSYTIV